MHYAIMMGARRTLTLENKLNKSSKIWKSLFAKQLTSKKRLFLNILDENNLDLILNG